MSAENMVKVGCLRADSETFLVLEAVITEIEGVTARRELDPISGMVLPWRKSAFLAIKFITLA